MSTPEIWTARTGLRRLAGHGGLTGDVDASGYVCWAMTDTSSIPKPAALFDPGPLPADLTAAVTAVTALLAAAVDSTTDPDEVRQLLSASIHLADLTRLLASRASA